MKPKSWNQHREKDMSRKQYRMSPQVFLQLGPDCHRIARMGPMPWSHIHEFLRCGSRPFDAEKKARETNNEKVLDMFSDALYDWNSTFADDEEGEQYHKTEGWVWYGFAVKAECEGVDVWMSMSDDYCSVSVNQEQIDSQARSCAMAAYEALLPIVKPEGGR